MKIATQKYARKAVGDLTPHPRNPREGDVGAIHESIAANGFYGAIIAQKSTGYVLAGNHRLQAAVAAGAKQVPVIEIDCDDATALRILLADNRTNDVASYDNAALADLLTELTQDGGLEGTGYDGDDLDDLLRLIESTSANPINPYEEWAAMPEYEQGDKNSVFRATIHFKSAEDADAFFTLINRPKKSSMWWPVDDEHVGSDVHQKYVAKEN